METKICKSCLENKPLNCYWISKSNSDGLMGKCKICVKGNIPTKSLGWKYEGDIHKTNEGYTCEIIKYRNAKSCDVKILENECVITDVEHGAVKSGRVKNPFHKSLWGLGYLGQGEHTTWDNVLKRNHKKYISWKSMLERCYSEDRRHSNIAYEGCTVDERWHNFQVFADWYEENYIDGWHLDKDILGGDSKIYSPENCCFIPIIINANFKRKYESSKERSSIISTVKGGFIIYINKNSKKVRLGSAKTYEEALLIFKKGKEEYIKSLAKKYKENLTQVVYLKLMNFKYDTEKY